MEPTDGGEAVKNLTKAWLAVMADCPYLQKQYIAALGYSAALESAMLEKLRPAMIKNGLALFIQDAELVSRERFINKNGTSMTSTIVKLRGLLVHAESGESVAVCALGEGADSSDKGVGKANTNGLKYLLRQNALIETGDEPEMERPDMEPAPVQHAPAPPPPPRPAPPAAKVETLPPAAAVTEPDGWRIAMGDVVRQYLKAYYPNDGANWPAKGAAIYAAAAKRQPSAVDITYDEASAMMDKLHDKASGRGLLPDGLEEAFEKWDDLDMRQAKNEVAP